MSAASILTCFSAFFEASLLAGVILSLSSPLRPWMLRNLVHFLAMQPHFISGRTYRVEKLFAKVAHDDYVDAANIQAIRIHMSHPPGDIHFYDWPGRHQWRACDLCRTHSSTPSSSAANVLAASCTIVNADRFFMTIVRVNVNQ